MGGADTRDRPVREKERACGLRKGRAGPRAGAGHARVGRARVGPSLEERRARVGCWAGLDAGLGWVSFLLLTLPLFFFKPTEITLSTQPNKTYTPNECTNMLNLKKINYL